MWWNQIRALFLLPLQRLTHPPLFIDNLRSIWAWTTVASNHLQGISQWETVYFIILSLTSWVMPRMIFTIILVTDSAKESRHYWNQSLNLVVPLPRIGMITVIYRQLLSLYSIKLRTWPKGWNPMVLLGQYKWFNYWSNWKLTSHWRRVSNLY